MADETFNPNELVPHKFRFIEFTDPNNDNIVVGRLTQIEDPSLNTTSENDSVVDAMQNEIMKLYRSKAGQFTASNSLFSSDLYALQVGSDKEVANADNKITVPVTDMIKADATGKVTLSAKPKEGSEPKHVYVLENNQISTKLDLDTAAVGETAPGAGKFGYANGVVTVPTDYNGKKILVEYEKETEKAIKIVNKAENFPKLVGFKASVYFKDPCTEKDILGYIVAQKAKLNPESIELALTFDGKHPFTVDFTKSYCDEDAELFQFIICGD